MPDYTRCVCGHILDHHNPQSEWGRTSPMRCAYRGCGCPRFVVAETSVEVPASRYKDGEVAEQGAPTSVKNLETAPGASTPSRCPTCGWPDPWTSGDDDPYCRDSWHLEDEGRTKTTEVCPTCDSPNPEIIRLISLYDRFCNDSFHRDYN